MHISSVTFALELVALITYMKEFRDLVLLGNVPGLTPEWCRNSFSWYSQLGSKSQAINKFSLLKSLPSGDIDSPSGYLAVLDEDICSINRLPTHKQVLSVQGGHLDNPGKVPWPVHISPLFVDHPALLVGSKSPNISVSLLDAHSIQLHRIIRYFDLSGEIIGNFIQFNM